MSEKSRPLTKKLSIVLPEELHAEFKAYCARTRRQMGPFVRQMIERLLEVTENKGETE